MSLIIKAKLKEFAKVDGKTLNVAADFGDALSDKVETIIKDACKRAAQNGRSTVMPKDL